MSVLSDYFPAGLNFVIKKAITIKPKVIANSFYVVTLDSDGMASIIDLNQESKVVSTARHIRDIFNEINDYETVHFITNTGTMDSIDHASSNLKFHCNENFGSDIIHMSAIGDIIIYTDVRGKVTINSIGSFWSNRQLDLPELVVTAAITNDLVLCLTVSGTLRMYQMSDHTSDLISITSSPEKENIAKVSATDGTVILLGLNGKVAYYSTDHNFTKVSSSREGLLDIDVVSEGDLLELLLDRRVRNNNKIIPHIKDIKAISSGPSQALIQIDGRVLTRREGEVIFTTIPRVRLTSFDAREAVFK